MASSSKSEQQSTGWTKLRDVLKSEAVGALDWSAAKLKDFMECYKITEDASIQAQLKSFMETIYDFIGHYKKDPKSVMEREKSLLALEPFIPFLKRLISSIPSMHPPGLRALLESLQGLIELKGYGGITYSALDEIERHLEDRKKDTVPPGIFIRFEKLYTATLEGDWETAKQFLEKHPYGLKSKITDGYVTILHIAAAVGHPEFFRNLLEQYESKDLGVLDRKGSNILHIAAENVKLEVAKSIVGKRPELTKMRRNDGSIPILVAATLEPPFSDEQENEAKQLIKYLLEETIDPFLPNKDEMDLLAQLARIGFHDTIVHILNKHKDRIYLILSDNNYHNVGKNFLSILASCRLKDFKSSARLKFWENWMYELVPDELPCSNKESPSQDIKPPEGQSEKVEEQPLQSPPCSSIADIEAPSQDKKPPEQKSQNVDQQPHQSSAVRQWLQKPAWKLVQILAPRKSEEIKKMKCRHGHAQRLLLYIFDQAKNVAVAQAIFQHHYEFLNLAAKNGIVEIISPWIQKFPHLMSLVPDDGMTPLHVAVYHRQDKIYNIIVDALGIYKTKVANRTLDWPTGDESSSTIHGKCSLLHMAAALPPSRRLKSIAGTALQMQHELQWFQEVEQHVDPIVLITIQSNNKTVREIFTEQHKDLVKEAEDWLKGTSKSCMVVTTLIATIVFAVAFQVPGGNDDHGVPHFVGQIKFTTFVISDSLALLFSLTSLLMFLSLLTSRYAEEDFSWKLPMKLLTGIFFLLIAMATTMISFVASVWIILGEKHLWLQVLVTVGAAIPVIGFLFPQLPMFVNTCLNTFRSRGIFYSSDAHADQRPKLMF